MFEKGKKGGNFHAQQSLATLSHHSHGQYMISGAMAQVTGGLNLRLDNVKPCQESGVGPERLTSHAAQITWKSTHLHTCTRTHAHAHMHASRLVIYLHVPVYIL